MVVYIRNYGILQILFKVYNCICSLRSRLKKARLITNSLPHDSDFSINISLRSLQLINWKKKVLPVRTSDVKNNLLNGRAASREEILIDGS